MQQAQSSSHYYALVDCNAFYASCEQVFDPDLAERPVVVLSNNDGCIIARSAGAKALGIAMGEPVFHREQFLKQHGVAVRSANFPLYGELSGRVMRLLQQFGPTEVYSIDEAFVALSGFAPQDLPALGHQIRETIDRCLSLPVCVGIGTSKTLAKVANHIAKQHASSEGVHTIRTAAQRKLALRQLAIEDVWGIGWRHARRLRKLGVQDAEQLSRMSESLAQHLMTIVGRRLVCELRGQPCLELEEVAPPRQGMCYARGFGRALYEQKDLAEALATFTSRVAEKLRAQGSAARLMRVWLETDPFRIEAPQYMPATQLTLPPTNDTPTLVKHAKAGLQTIYRSGYAYKKAGLFVTDLVPCRYVQGSLFDTGPDPREGALMRTVDQLNQRFGQDTVRVAQAGFARRFRMRQERLSPNYLSDPAQLPVVRA
jgi:DNA polymerase V